MGYKLIEDYWFFILSILSVIIFIGIYYIYIKFLFKICKIKVKKLSKEEKEKFKKKSFEEYLLPAVALSIVLIALYMKLAINPYSILPPSFEDKYIKLVLVSLDYIIGLLLSFSGILLVIRKIYKKEEN